MRGTGYILIVELVGRTNKQLFLKNSLKINRMLYYMKIKTKRDRKDLLL